MDTETLIQEIGRRFSYDSETGVISRKRAYGKFAAGSPVETLSEDKYLIVCVRGKMVRGHQVAWLLTHGDLPRCIDHVNGIKTDNRIANLRNASLSVNAQNKRVSKSNTSGFLGVSLYEKKGLYRAQIRIPKGKNVWLGDYDTPEAAHAAYLTAKRQLHEGCTI